MEKKLYNELALMVGLMQRMIINEANDEDIDRIKDYISKLYATRQSYKKNNIKQLFKKYVHLDKVVYPPLKRKANVETKNFIDDISNAGKVEG